ncbi:MAG TPA: hypothetical protein ENH02_06135 [Bacteroidetes bacterium]|nr:hypothetical protein [Bacteroidota bacterium]
MRNLIITFILLSLQFFWSGCHKDHLIGEFLLTEEMKSQNPFHGGETLYFISDSVKEFVLDGVFRRNQIYKYQPSVTESDYYLIEVEITSVGSLLSNGI